MGVAPILLPIGRSGQHGVRAIQLAIAPVFLVTGVVALLSLLDHRLARIIDRARALERRFLENPGGDAILEADLATLARRAKLMNWAIGLGTGCALLVSSAGSSSRPWPY
ncbi:MAG: DUF2721 domain-containing protein [Gemmatimonadota bacterium]